MANLKQLSYPRTTYYRTNSSTCRKASYSRLAHPPRRLDPPPHHPLHIQPLPPQPNSVELNLPINPPLLPVGIGVCLKEWNDALDEASQCYEEAEGSRIVGNLVSDRGGPAGVLCRLYRLLESRYSRREIGLYVGHVGFVGGD